MGTQDGDHGVSGKFFAATCCQDRVDHHRSGRIDLLQELCNRLGDSGTAQKPDLDRGDRKLGKENQGLGEEILTPLRQYGVDVQAILDREGCDHGTSPATRRRDRLDIGLNSSSSGRVVTGETQYPGFVSHDLATEHLAMTATLKNIPRIGIETGHRPRS